MGSEGSVHNLGALRHSGPADDWIIQFEQWLLAAVEGNQFERLTTPSGFSAMFSQARPSLEHYAPLVVAWAAGDPDLPGRRIHQSFTYGNLGMSCCEFGNRIAQPAGAIHRCESAASEIVDSLHPQFSNSAESAEKPLRALALAEPFPGTVAQGLVLVIAKEFSGL